MAAYSYTLASYSYVVLAALPVLIALAWFGTWGLAALFRTHRRVPSLVTARASSEPAWPHAVDHDLAAPIRRGHCFSRGLPGVGPSGARRPYRRPGPGPLQGAAVARSRSRSTRRRIFPVADLGISSTNSTRRTFL